MHWISTIPAVFIDVSSLVRQIKDYIGLIPSDGIKIYISTGHLRENSTRSAIDTRLKALNNIVIQTTFISATFLIRITRKAGIVPLN